MKGVVVVEDFHPSETLLDITVSVTGPNSFEQSQPVRQIVLRRYQTSMPLKGEGRYQVMIGANGLELAAKRRMPDSSFRIRRSTCAFGPIRLYCGISLVRPGALNSMPIRTLQNWPVQFLAIDSQNAAAVRFLTGS